MKTKTVLTLAVFIAALALLTGCDRVRERIGGRSQQEPDVVVRVQPTATVVVTVTPSPTQRPATPEPTSTPEPTRTPIATAQPTATAVPTAAPTASPAPASTQPPVAPTQQPAVAVNFNPYPFYSQSCGPEKNSLGGCIWDVGVMGSLADPGGRDATQIGIVKGVSVSWPKGGKTANSSTNGRCALIVLLPNSWFEDLTVKDANVTVYNVSTSDIQGWLRTLVVQNAFEQQSNYNCPSKRFEDVEQWGSPIASPPCGTPGFMNCPSSATAVPAPQAAVQATPAPSCDTVNCKDRRASVDSGGQARFSAGEAVYGFRITIGGRNYSNCWFESAPGDGVVIYGVVNPWTTEVQRARKCA